MAQPSESGYRNVPSDRPVRLAWLDANGRVRCIPAKCIDVTNKRIHVEAPEQIPLQTRVMLRADGMSLAGSANVKYLTRYGTTFILVLETN